MAASQTQSLYSSLQLTHKVVQTSSGSDVHCYISDLGPDAPILALIHGYPQSAYEHITANTKRSVGRALLEALSVVFDTTASQTPRKVVLAGHDRGARISHRLTVDFTFPTETPSFYSTLNLVVVGTVLLDIIPTLQQWQAFSDPVVCSGAFHWPLLANPDVATDLILAYGGDRWCKTAHTRLAGPNPESIGRVSANNALDIYAELFRERETIYYTALDYAAGAAPEADEQKEDQKAGRKVGVPLLVIFSEARLGSSVDVAGVWKDWIADGVDLEGYGVGEGRGHYLPEEAYEIVSPKIATFINKVTGSASLA
ncbi:hypothetical protein AYO22_07385 [Fonsecaea multimorphosa]|nr:hypothetical protein AYO22_07385 [Fonsecaea multimorphosa]